MTDFIKQVDNIGYDLSACLTYNDIGIKEEDIASVLAEWEGEHDGDDYRWVVALKDGRYGFIQGWCDYTGWDCQSGGSIEFAATPEEAAHFASGEEVTAAPLMNPPGGLGRMVSILAGEFMENSGEVETELRRQITEGKAKTTRQDFDADWKDRLTT